MRLKPSKSSPCLVVRGVPESLDDKDVQLERPTFKDFQSIFIITVKDLMGGSLLKFPDIKFYFTLKVTQTNS